MITEPRGQLADDAYDDGVFRLHIQSGGFDAAPAAAAPAPLGRLAITQRTEVTFIESNVADLPTLLKGLAGAEVHLLDAGQDGLRQIAAILDGRGGIDALHIISHGDTAAVNFGALRLDGGNLDAHQADLRAIGASMAAGGDILLYGCDIGAGGAGRAFIDRLAEATGADLAASSNPTGAAALGGDWRLEISSGRIDTRAVVDPALAALYRQTLAVPSAVINFDTPGNFGPSPPNSTSNDILYNVAGPGGGAYQLKFDGQQHVYKSNGYLISDPNYNGENALNVFFTGGQVFTPTEIKVSSYRSGGYALDLVFKGYDANNQLLGTDTFTSIFNGGYNTIPVAGLTNIARLVMSTTKSGGYINLSIDDLVLSNIHSSAATVTGVGSTKADGSYKAGDVIEIHVAFDAAVAVTGTPRLTLGTGGGDRAVDFSGGGGTDTLTFSYTVQAGDNSADLDFAGTTALSLNGGTISAGGNAAILTLAAPGAAGSLSANHAIVIDTTAPTLSITSDVPALKSGETATITFTFSEDPGASFAWDGSSGDVQVSGGTLGAISGTGLTRSATFTPTASTNHGEAGISVANGLYHDAAGNPGGAGATPALSFDTLAGTATSAPALDAGSDSGFSDSDGISNDVAPVFTGTAEANATVRLYDSNGTTELGHTTADGSGNWRITSGTLTQGPHTLTARQTDPAGNVSAASDGFVYTLDTTAPSALALGATSIALSNAGNGATITTLSASDASGVQYSLAAGDNSNDADNGKFSIVGDNLEAAQNLGVGTYHIHVKATDAAGNESVGSFAITVADAPAVTSITRADDASSTVPTAATSVSYTVLFSQAVTGVDAGDFVLHASGNAAGTIAAVTPSGDGERYTVTVTGVSGDGTLRLDLSGSGTNIQNGSSIGIVGGHEGNQSYRLDHTAAAAPSTPAMTAGTDTGTVGDGVTSNTTPVFTGTAEANATVKLYDSNGSTVLGTAAVDDAGHWSITSGALALGAHALTVKQFDRAGNASPASAALALTIEAPPAPQEPTTPPPTTIDGVPVTQQPVTLPGGGGGTQIVIPIVTPDRSDSSGDAGVADIPLVISGAGTLLGAQVAPGFGLSATGGASRPAGDSLDLLTQAILAVTPDHAGGDQGHLTGNGAAFLKQLAGGVPLLLQTITPSSGATAPGGALTLTGTSTEALHTALVIDATRLAAGAQLVLNAVDFAAIVGAANVSGNTSGQILTGDAASQQFTVGAGGHSSVFAGGGGDTLVFTTTTTAAGAGAQGTAPPAGTTILHGGLGDDSASFNGARSDYTVDSHDGYVVVTAKAQPNQHALAINVESLKFSDATVTVQNRAELDAIAGLYQDVLGRQADYLGVDFWAAAEKNGVSLGKIALDIIGSAESQARRAAVFNGDSAHDVELLYQGIFSRHSDAGGLAFWLDKMANGMTLTQVASSFMLSGESQVHKIGVQDWDFQMG